MKPSSLILSLLACVSLSANADMLESINKEARDPLHVALTLHAVDYLQTLQIAKECAIERDASADYRQAHADMIVHSEVNPILGTCPSQSSVTKYFAFTAIAGYALHQALPEKYKPVASYIWLAVEGASVGHNFKVGVKFPF